MSGSTTRLALYLAGGGSTGSYGADEVADVDKLNGNFVKIDGHLYPATATLTTLAALLPNVPEGAVVAVGRYLLTGSFYHQASLWEKNDGKWMLVHGTAIFIFGEGGGTQGITDMTGGIASSFETFWTNNAASFNIIAGMRMVSGQMFEVRRYSGGTWKGWDTPLLSFTPTVTGITGNGNNADPGYGLPRSSYRWAAGRVVYRGALRLTNSTTNDLVRITTPVPLTDQELAGTFSALDVSAGTVWQLTSVKDAASVVIFFYLGSDGTGIRRRNTVPVTWADGDIFYWDFTYDPA